MIATIPFLNFAFLLSLAATLACAGIVVLVGHRRPPGTFLTWGEALVAGTFAFGAMFLAYGIVPHQWLDHADRELQWRKDKIVFGPADILDKLPFTITYEAVRDIIVTVIYIALFAGQIALWAWWQKRGQAKPKALPRSAYGRPLTKPSRAAVEAGSSS
jgi:hypothetical protein